jgi:glutathione S-transferase
MLTLYYSPWTRATGVRILLEELGAPYALRVIDRATGEQRGEAYRRVNPLGKVPAIDHDGAIVTEQVAIYIYLADAFPERGLAPPIGDKLRGPYLRWLAFYGSAFEPALVDFHLKREPAPPAVSPYGTYDEVIGLLSAQLSAGPYLLGARFTAADLLWGTALTWTTQFKLVPERPEFAAYMARINGRPVVQRVNAEDKALAATHHPPASSA